MGTETPGRHAAPVNGTVTNGALVPFTFPSGPAAAWPQQDDPGQSRTAPDERGRWWRAIDGDTVIRVLAAIVVLAVAAFAAVVSYSHIFALGFHHGQDGAAARLLPLSVDGLIASASLFMLYAARNGIVLRRLSWPRVMLWLGIAATVAANVLYGLPFGYLAAVVSAWPAVAFVGSVEMAVRFVRDARHDGTPVQSDAAPVFTPHHESRGENGGEKPSRRPPSRKTAAPVKKIDRAAAAIRDNPGMKNAELAALVGCDVRTIQQARNSKTGSTT